MAPPFDAWLVQFLQHCSTNSSMFLLCRFHLFSVFFYCSVTLPSNSKIMAGGHCVLKDTDLEKYSHLHTQAAHSEVILTSHDNSIQRLDQEKLPGGYCWKRLMSALKKWCLLAPLKSSLNISQTCNSKHSSKQRPARVRLHPVQLNAVYYCVRWGLGRNLWRCSLCNTAGTWQCAWGISAHCVSLIPHHSELATLHSKESHLPHCYSVFFWICFYLSFCCNHRRLNLRSWEQVNVSAPRKLPRIPSLQKSRQIRF